MELKPACENCTWYKPDKPGERYPNGGTGWCEVKRRGNGSPDPRRTHHATWCDRHKPERSK